MGTKRADMRSNLRLLVIFAAVFTIFSWNSPLFLHAEESSCASCHTSMKKLIKITRAMEAAKPEAEKSTESEGEG
ncbi:MAG: hypothetical protein U9R24_05245 [Thermodesulfobacteriota bacterium]|nr:hypothetical protein [Thermodesulfobacteriota bacterium]